MCVKLLSGGRRFLIVLVPTIRSMVCKPDCAKHFFASGISIATVSHVVSIGSMNNPNY